MIPAAPAACVHALCMCARSLVRSLASGPLPDTDSQCRQADACSLYNFGGLHTYTCPRDF